MTVKGSLYLPCIKIRKKWLFYTKSSGGGEPPLAPTHHMFSNRELCLHKTYMEDRSPFITTNFEIFFALRNKPAMSWICQSLSSPIGMKLL